MKKVNSCLPIAFQLAEIFARDYTLLMDMGITYNKSAFKHGVTETDIEWAFLHPIRNGLLPDYANKYLLIGFDRRGNPHWNYV